MLLAGGLWEPLVLEEHCLINDVQPVHHFPTSLGHDHFFQGVVGHECIHQATIESFSSAPQTVEANCPINFMTLKLIESLTSYANATRELRSVHFKSLANGANPTT